jgi:minor extracellular serine protease Vpr
MPVRHGADRGRRDVTVRSRHGRGVFARGATRPRVAGRPLVLAAAAAVAAAILAGTLQGAAGDGLPRTAARAWHAVFGDRPQAVLSGKQRVLVVLASPSLADRMAAAEEAPSPELQRRWTTEAEGAQRLLLTGLRKRGVPLSREHTFTRTFNGFSAGVSPRALAELERATGVAGVYPVRTVYPAAAEVRPDLGEGRAPRSQVSLPGFDGHGVTVALLDGGVDRSHPDLRGRILRGYDLLDGDRSVAPLARPDQPATLETHATRMAGLVVGRNGVAPEARVLPVRVLGWQPTTDGGYAELGRGDVLLAGLELAVDPDRDGDVEDGATVALAPVVEPYASFADSPEARAVAGAASLGTLVVAPTGNDGRPGRGFGSIGAPAGASEALSVGALDTRRRVYEARAVLRLGSDTVLDDSARILGAVAPEASAREVVALLGPTLGRSDRPPFEQADGSGLADFFDRDGISLVAGRAVILPDGEGLAARVRNAAAAGAAAVLVSGAELPAGALDLDEAAALPVLALPRGAAQEVLDGLAAAKRASVALSSSVGVANEALMDVSAFSSGGVAFDGRVKPDVVAPGVGLATADPGGRDATATGTSAAAAVAAGAAALVSQARPELDPLELKGVIVGSAGQLARGSAPLAVTAQGAGLVDPRRAAAAELVVEPATLAFGRADGAGWSEVRSFTVHNVSTRDLTAGFGLASDAAGDPLAFFAEPTSVTLRPGESAEIRIGVEATGDVAGGVGGALVVSALGAQSARVPWAIAPRASGRGALVGDVQLSHRAFSPSRTAPVVLAFSAGRVDESLEGESIEPVGVIEVELWSSEGQRLGVLARLRDVLPGRYAFGLTGRGPDGRALADGTYVIRLRAYPVDGDDGARPSTAEAMFTIES